MDVQALMEGVVNNVCRGALDSIKRGDSSAKLKRAIVSALREARAENFDTEEREWLCAEVVSIAKTAGVSITNELNSWLYGRALGTLLRLSAAIKPAQKRLATYSTSCEFCSATLSAHVTELQTQIAEGGWIVCRCNACSRLSLLRLGPHIKRMKNDGFQFVRHLSADEYTAETATSTLRALQIAGS